MFDPEKCISEALFFEEPNLGRPLTPGDRMLSSGLFCRISKERAAIYYLTSSDELIIPREYLNLFSVLGRRDGGILRGLKSSSGLSGYLALGIELPGMLLSGADSRGISEILGKMVVIGTSLVRKIIPELETWEIRNTENRIEI